MFGLFGPKTFSIDGIELPDFRPWGEKMHKTGQKLVGPNAFKALADYNRLKTKMIQQYRSYRTIEARIFAAYTAFDPNLKDLVKAEIQALPPVGVWLSLGRVYLAFIQNGLNGCAHLLHEDYSSEFKIIEEGPEPKRVAKWLESIESFPDSWIGNEITLEELDELHTNLYQVPLNEHSLSPYKIPSTAFEWVWINEIVNLYPDVTIHSFDSGFSTGILLLRNGVCIATTTTGNYRRQAV